jgi:hypothetical protein
VVSDRGEDVVDKGGVGTISNRRGTTVVPVALLVEGKALLTEKEAFFGISLKTDE